jgi:glucose-6-phosphate 1-dehydrogenase
LYHYITGDEEERSDDQSLAEVFDVIAKHEEEHGDASGRNRIFYLALPHELYPPVANAIHRRGRAPEPGWTRLVLEKPFGIDLPSAR